MPNKDDIRLLAVAAGLAERARPLSRPNPAVGAVISKDGVILGRGWTQEGGRPHAEAMALAQAGDSARGGEMHVTLEPCAHRSERGTACADLAAQAGLARVVIGVEDPDPRTAGQGMARLREAGIAADCLDDAASRESLAGYLMLHRAGRPHVTVKLATSLDGCLAMASGESQWITGPVARAHAHRERARAYAILVGGGTLRADNPSLDVRLPGLEARSPDRFALTWGEVPPGWQRLTSPQAVTALADVQYLFVEGGAHTAAAFLAADLVDRLLIYRAPILIGGGLPALADIGLTRLADAHGLWKLADRRTLGTDMLEILERTR